MMWIKGICFAGLSSIAMMASVSIPAALAAESVAPAVPTKFPMGIICWNEKTEGWVVGYLVSVEHDGSAIYMPPGAELAARVTTQGMVEPLANRPTVMDCRGKTLDELRAMGRVIELQPAK